jgi:hypothetical protein
MLTATVHAFFLAFHDKTGRIVTVAPAKGIAAVSIENLRAPALMPNRVGIHSW